MRETREIRVKRGCGRYLLQGHTAVPCENLVAWAGWMENADRAVAQTFVGPYAVSTVFLGLDHNFSGYVWRELAENVPPLEGIVGEDRPLLFESMIFPRKEFEESPPPGLTLEQRLRLSREWRTGLDEELLDSQDRWATWKEAEQGHEAMVRLVEERTGQRRDAGQPGKQA